MIYCVPLWVTVDATSSDAAFALVRKHFAVISDKQRTMVLNKATSIDFDIDEPIPMQRADIRKCRLEGKLADLYKEVQSVDHR